MTSDIDQADLDALRRILVPKVEIDEAKVRDIVTEVLGRTVFPTVTVVVKDGTTTKIDRLTHKQLGETVSWLASGEHVMVVGPAGGGKSHLAQDAADVLSLTFYNLSLSAQTPVSALVGYMDANGTYHRTPFRDAFEHGGLFCLDETDNGHPNTVNVMNSALANGIMAFPDGMVTRHENFKVVATANTYGRGQNRQYVGRNQLDAAFMDRFTAIEFAYDDAIEHAMLVATGAHQADISKVLEFAKRVRKNIDSEGLNVILSPRGTQAMARGLAAGIAWDTVVDRRVRRGVDDGTWRKLTA